jgi:hypothetical protein
MRRLALLPIFALSLTTMSAVAQTPARDSQPSHILRTKQGSTLMGWVVGASADTVRFQTNGGLLAIPTGNIAELKAIESTQWHDGEYWFADPHKTRLFFAPTGRMLAPREGYYSNTYLILNSVNAGVNSRVSLGGSVTLIPDASSQVAWFTPKVGVLATDNLNIAVGGLFGYVGFADVDERSFGILYGVSTFGGADASVTTGLGWGYAGGKLSASPAALLGGSVRVSRRAALVTENYLLPSGDITLLGYGVRFFGEQLSVDLAFFNNAQHPVFPGIPFVSFAVKF